MRPQTKCFAVKKKKKNNSKVARVFYCAVPIFFGAIQKSYFFFCLGPFSRLLPKTPSDTRSLSGVLTFFRGCVSPSRAAVKQNHIPGGALASRRPSRPDALKRPQSKRRYGKGSGDDFAASLEDADPPRRVKRVNGVASGPRQLDCLRIDSNTRRGIVVGGCREVWTLFLILFMHSRRGKALAVLFVAAPRGPVQDSTGDHKAAKRANLQTHNSGLH